MKVENAQTENSAAGGASELTDVLCRCPCGKTPTSVGVYDLGQGGKWAAAVPDCCGEWMIEFRTGYFDLDSDECKKLAREAWNEAPRAA